MGLFAFGKPSDGGTVRAVKHSPVGRWHRYDVMLASGYGWETMLAWADYMTASDLVSVSEVTVGEADVGDRNVTASYRRYGEKCADTPEMQTEQGLLSVAGWSRRLKVPLKMIWYNQTNALCFFTPVKKSKRRMRRYAETIVCCGFLKTS